MCISMAVGMLRDILARERDEAEAMARAEHPDICLPSTARPLAEQPGDDADKNLAAAQKLAVLP